MCALQGVAPFVVVRTNILLFPAMCSCFASTVQTKPYRWRVLILPTSEAGYGCRKEVGCVAIPPTCLTAFVSSGNKLVKIDSALSILAINCQWVHPSSLAYQNTHT